MDKLTVICVDDQREVLNALPNDLSLFSEFIEIEACESGQEVLRLVEEIDNQGDHVALVISDQVMPEMTGVELLSNIHGDARFVNTKKLLLTGLATHADTIRAINEAGLDFYIAKPWSTLELHQKVKELLTAYLLENGMDYQEFRDIIDQEVLLKFMRNGGGI